MCFSYMLSTISFFSIIAAVFVGWADAKKLVTRRAATPKSCRSVGALRSPASIHHHRGLGGHPETSFDSASFPYYLTCYFTGTNAASRDLVLSVRVFVCTRWADWLLTPCCYVLVPLAHRVFVLHFHFFLLMFLCGISRVTLRFANCFFVTLWHKLRRLERITIASGYLPLYKMSYTLLEMLLHDTIALD